MTASAPVAPTVADLVDKIVRANRILYRQGIVDGLGHASARHPDDPTLFLLSRNRAPGLVVHEDVVTYTLDGDPVSPAPGRAYLERFIHSEIYRARPDVMAVVHSHSPSVIPFGATRQRLQPIFHMAGFLGSGTAHFEIRDVRPENDLLVRDAELGRALAQSLAGCSCVLMRGHGSTVVGSSVEQAVYRAIYVEVNAKLQMQAMGMGEVTYLTEREAELAAAANDSQIQRSWDLWCRAIEAELPRAP
jgi:ribulose-5-phosphate 4-epimerase/fuculose-1-phosphate aldolase